MPPPPPSAIRGSNQVSRIMKDTRMESKTNQLSLRQSRFLRNAQNLTKTSKVKYVQKMFSATTNTGSAVVMSGAIFQSVSTPIHVPLRQITPRVKYSNFLLLASFAAGELE